MDKADEQVTKTSGLDTDGSFSKATTIDFDQPDALVGQLLDGRFLIGKNLADKGADAGGIGLVYLAKDEKLSRGVVVKILQEAALKNDDIVRKFLHEKEALTRLKHPGIVQILDAGTLTDGNPFMVMEYIEGYSLRKALEKTGRLPLDSAAHLIEAITDALSHAHSKQIIHRDIKPENIMLTPQDDGFDHVRLIDFGIARVEGSMLAPQSMFASIMGTLKYMPPEQHLGSLDLTPAADIYSAAIVAYEILTGQLPFKAQPTGEIGKQFKEIYKLKEEGVKMHPRELRPDLSPEAEGILLSALRFESEDRPQNARVFGRELAQALRGNATSTPRNPIKTVLGVLIGFLTAAAILLWGNIYFINPPPETPATNTNVQTTLVKCPESSLPNTFDRYFEGDVTNKGKTVRLTMQLMRNNTILTGVAKTFTKTRIVSDELHGTIHPDGSFDVSSTPIGKEGTGKWQGRIKLDCTVTGEWTTTTKDGTDPSPFLVKYTAVENK